MRLSVVLTLVLCSTSAVGQRYVPSRLGGCATKLAYGSIQTPAGDCRRMGGAMNGNPADGEWTLCYLDWCAEGQQGTYVAAKSGSCTTRVGFGIITTTGGDCRRLGGAMSGAPGENDRTACRLDWCSQGGTPAYSAARVGSCGAAKVGSGIISTTGADCRRLGGGMNGTPADAQWTECHLDWCATTGANVP